MNFREIRCIVCSKKNSQGNIDFSICYFTLLRFIIDTKNYEFTPLLGLTIPVFTHALGKTKNQKPEGVQSLINSHIISNIYINKITTQTQKEKVVCIWDHTTIPLRSLAY